MPPSRFVVVVTTLASCMPSYHFEQPPLHKLDAGDAARCYEAKRFALVAGHGTWTKELSTSDTMSTYIVTETYGANGIGIYRGDELVPAAAVVDSLPDRELARGYREALARTEHDSVWYPRYRTAAFGLAVGGLALVSGALAVVVENPDSDATWPLVAGGTIAALLSIIPTILAGRTYDGAVEHDLTLTMFTTRQWAQRMTSSVEAANAKLAAECAYTPADLPITPATREMIGKP